MARERFQIVGLDEFQSTLDDFGDAVAVRIARNATFKGAGHLRKALRRSRPKNLKKGFPLKSINAKKLTKRKGLPSDTVASRVYVNGLYQVFERGRKSYRRNGVSVAGSPQMARFAWLYKTRRQEEGEVGRIIIEALKQEMFKEAIEVYKKTQRGRVK